MNSLPDRPRPTILNSWKEISTYLGRGIRTAQRWEQELHLPIHRVGTGRRAPVFALEHEVQSWLQTIRTWPNPSYREVSAPHAAHAKVTSHAAELARQLITNTRENRRLMRELHENVEQMMRSRELVRRAREARSAHRLQSAAWEIPTKPPLVAANAR